MAVTVASVLTDLSDSAGVDKHQDVGMCCCQGVEQWRGPSRQRGVGDVAGVGQLSEQHGTTRNLDGPVERLQRRQDAVQLTQAFL